MKLSSFDVISPSATVEYRAGYIELAPSSNESAAFIATPASGHYFLAIPDGCHPISGAGNTAEQPQSGNTSRLVPADKKSKKRSADSAFPRK